MRLETYSVPKTFDRGATWLRQGLWLLCDGVFVRSWLPGSRWRVAALRAFGAQVGKGVVIKPGVAIKFPWKLRVGDHCWIGERVWIDNLAPVTIGSNVCLSQGAYLCTGSHDWAKASFDLRVAPIEIKDRVWVCARSTIAPGTVVGEGAVISLGSVFSGVASEWTVYRGTNAVSVRPQSGSAEPPTS